MPPANSSSPLAVSPGLIEVDLLTPGQVYEGEFTVLNPTLDGVTSRYSITVGPLTFDDEYYSPAFDDASDFNQIVDWIKISEPKGSLAPGERRTIHYQITVPDTAPAGGQYASFLVASEDPAGSEQQEGIAVAAKSRIAILLYSTVEGATREEGHVIENNVPGIVFDQPIKTSSLIINSGNVHIKAKYTLRIYPLFSSEEIYTNEETPVTSTVVPDTTLYNEKVWEDTPLLGLFRVEQDIDFGDVINHKETVTLVAPTWFVLLSLVFLVAIFYALIERLSKYKKARKKP